MEQQCAWIAGGYADAGAMGLYLVRHRVGRLHVECVVAPFSNVSAGVRRGALWYLVDEVAGDVVLIDSTNWREIVRFPSAGHAPCHLALDATGTMLVVANYGDGTIALFALGDRGLPTGDPDCYRHTGNGPDPDRQADPHAH